ncbi:Allergen V5/Tpx-1 related protein, partial [Paenibacillus jamilae]
MKLLLLALAFVLGIATATDAAAYAGSISAYRRANRMPAVTLDARLNAMALKQAQAMSATGSVSHS